MSGRASAADKSCGRWCFKVITTTVTLAGLTGGLVARLLGLKRPSQEGWVILGANGLARGIARILSESGQEVVCIDSNADHCLAAEADCTRVIYGMACGLATCGGRKLIPGWGPWP
ncbi:MAG: NAD-binding protein [Desulfobacterales bacterium]